MSPKTKKGLGKGLDALLSGNRGALENRSVPIKETAVKDAAENETGQATLQQAPISANGQAESKEGQLIELAVDQLQPGKYQPRRVIDNEQLEELAASIRRQGVMQPIIVRSVDSGKEVVGQTDSASRGALDKRYEIIAGERRWRAVQLAGMHSIPAIIKDVSDDAAIAMALIENLQRDDLNPMDEAYALYRLQQEFELTHQEVAEAVGKSRAAVSNALRLMNLNKDVKLLLENGDIEMGHARALLALSDQQQSRAAAEVVDKRFSVRQAEALVKSLQNPRPKPQKPAGSGAANDANICKLQNDLSEKLGASVSLQHHSKGKGKLVISYNSLDELDGILEHIH